MLIQKFLLTSSIKTKNNNRLTSRSPLEIAGSSQITLDKARRSKGLLRNIPSGLTEVTVDDFAARYWTDLVHLIGTSAQQTTWRLFDAAAYLSRCFLAGAPVR